MEDITLIIVSFNSADILERCQKKLLSSGAFPVIIVDNASTDLSGERLKKMFPETMVIETEQNIGYGRGANIGLHATKTPYALLLNPDLKTSAKDINKLLDHAKADKDNTAIWGPATDKTMLADMPPQNVKWISGSAMLFDADKIRQVGLFDENIFLFSEETDLCERTLAANFEIKICRDVFFDHLIGQACPYDPKIEYMKWWHFGWSQCYRMTKNGHCTVFRNPYRKWFTYRLHSLVSSSRQKRMKWKAKADGTAAFIRGEKAFDSHGNPQMQPGRQTGSTNTFCNGISV